MMASQRTFEVIDANAAIARLKSTGKRFYVYVLPQRIRKCRQAHGRTVLPIQKP